MGIDEGSEGGPDYVLVGHVARDVFGGESRLGGAVVYAGAMAARLGRRVGIVTAGNVSLNDEAALAEAAVVSLPSKTTTFEHHEDARGRALRLLDCAAPLTEAAI